ncbi:DUF3037 domain-containing protein [Pedobacter insulae]|uniref:DUF3037 domain-containing protein n=1 Tax=Pedobacter insulae TaxID=414048 RepID=A0A1I2UH88_9SPHI|nr:DUF3037 domain-containing protein [Pedobacter insulae]SFG76522.1 Protein of unknown function [Pedobacter insulae]
MPEKHLFEYAVIRVVPRVEREEFINVGIILYCAKQKFLRAAIVIDQDRLLAFAPQIEIDFLEKNLNAIVTICEGGDDAGPIGRLDNASRFRWLTATRSTVVQPSKVHPGFCKNAEETFEKLTRQLVL